MGCGEVVLREGENIQDACRLFFYFFGAKNEDQVLM